MNAILLTPRDLMVAASLILVDGVLSAVLRLNLHWQILWAAARMVVQLLLVGLILHVVFGLASPPLTLTVIVAMMVMAGREVAARPRQRLARYGNFAIGSASICLATVITATLALTTAIRPQPWYDARYAISLAGIILGNAMNAASLSLDSILDGVRSQRAAIEAQLALGATIRQAMSRLVRTAVRRGLLPSINTMSAAGIITLPGIMTGQILAGMPPMEAVKYQILLMFLLTGGSGLAAVTVVLLAARRLTDPRQRLRLDRMSDR